MVGNGAKTQRLEKHLSLFDVYAISTGAMFSSGFFLLPGLAAAMTGASMPLAYLVAGVLIIPAMLSKAELATAMPRAGGAYYYLDRALGPVVGSVGGLGAWIALVLKSAFALLGMGAYLALLLDLPIKPLAVGLTLAFAALNVVGAKESSGLQRVLVTVLVGILGYFTARGLLETLGVQGAEDTIAAFQPLFGEGLGAFFATVGFVFVSYAGLTKVASVAEEVQNPDRNIPLGMLLSLATATTIYVIGAAALVALLPPEVLHADLTPIATAAPLVMTWLPAPAAVGLVVVAAIAAFASTGNAGILSASRFPLAMARDQLLPGPLARLGRFGTPTVAIALTAVLMIAMVVALDVASVAKLASAFQLMLFGTMNLAVIVMRESHIDYYRPGFRSPLYPWMQLAGIGIPVWLIIQMGWFPVVGVLLLSALFVGWYYGWARSRVVRSGAIYHLFERLGRRVYRGLDHELRAILEEKGLHEDDPLEDLVMSARLLDLEGATSFRDALQQACKAACGSCPVKDAGGREACTGAGCVRGLGGDTLLSRLVDETRQGLMPVVNGAAMPHLRLGGLSGPQLVLIRIRGGAVLDLDESVLHLEQSQRIYAVALLVSPAADTGQHLRILAHLAGRFEEPSFLEHWLVDTTETQLKETLLRDDRMRVVRVRPDRPGGVLVGLRMDQVPLPQGAMLALVRRRGETFIPEPGQRLQLGDRLTVIGDSAAMAELEERLASGDAAQRARKAG